MNYKNIDSEIWNRLAENGDIITGYEGLFLNKEEGQEGTLLIFKDEHDKLHFVIEESSVKRSDLPDPKVKGLHIELKKFKFKGKHIEQFIDIECNSNAYIREFTEIVKEVASKILADNQKSIIAIKDVINAWKSFWGLQVSGILTEEEQIGLICELKVLRKLCELDAEKALNSWKGPLREKYDFLFSEWVFEIKGTQRDGHIHIVNGIDQLDAPHGKNLAFISFLVTKSSNTNSRSLEYLISNLENNIFRDRIDLLDRFHDLLVRYGYSKIHSDDYSNIKYDIYDGKFYLVNDDFPKLTLASLKKSPDKRISELRYTINLNDVLGDSFEGISFNKFC